MPKCKHPESKYIEIANKLIACEITIKDAGLEMYGRVKVAGQLKEVLFSRKLINESQWAKVAEYSQQVAIQKRKATERRKIKALGKQKPAKVCQCSDPNCKRGNFRPWELNEICFRKELLEETKNERLIENPVVFSTQVIGSNSTALQRS